MVDLQELTLAKELVRADGGMGWDLVRDRVVTPTTQALRDLAVVWEAVGTWVVD